MNFKLTLVPEKKFSRNAMLYLGAVIFYSIATGGFGMLQGIYIKELKFGEDFLGTLISLKTLAMAVTAFPCALIVNRIGKRKALFASFLLTPVFIIFQGYFKMSWFILLFAVLQGCSDTLLSVTGGPFLMENSRGEQRIKIFSYSFAVNTFSTMAGYISSGHAVEILGMHINIISSYRYMIIVLGIIGLLSLLFILFINENKSEESTEKSVSIQNSLLVFKERGVYQFIIYNFLIGFGAGLVVPYFNVYLKYKINIDLDQLGVIMMLSQAATGLGGLIMPVMSKRYGKVNTILICQIASIPFLLLIATPPSILIVSVAFFMRSALMNMPGPVINNMSMELVHSEKRSILSSMFNISSNLSRAISAFVAGIIMKNLPNGYEIPYYITSVLYIIATLYFYKTFKNYNKQQSLSF